VDEAGTDELRRAVETQHGGTATFVKIVPIREMFGREIVWEDGVHVFELAANPKARRAYAWSSPLEGGGRQFFAVLHIPPITGPVRAVRSVIGAD
jgi:hypothetical protein